MNPPIWARNTARVPAEGPFDVGAALRMLASHTIAGFDRLDPITASYERVLRIEDADVRVHIRLTVDGVTASMDSDDRSVQDAVERTVRRWFDLDTAIDTVDRHLSTSSHLEADIRRRPGVRLTRYPDPFEAIVTVILGQGISLAAARNVMLRLVAAPDGPTPGAVFPAPADLAARSPEDLQTRLRVPLRRATALRAVAALVTEGYAPRDDGLEPLAEIPGIGPWTVDTFALRAGFDDDAFPVGDAVLHRRLGEKDARVLHDAAAAWSPYRGYAAMRLWTGDASATTPVDARRTR